MEAHAPLHAISRDVGGLPVPVPAVQAALLEWYQVHRRDLPWRRTNDPYHIWVSEVMLQQTRVDTALAYYERFIRRFPDAESLAAADVDDVLKVWEGLGYYRRARNLHRAVAEVVAQYGGRVPNDPQEFGALPGVGPYTTGAVLSIAYDLPLPAVDGNVTRVLSRLCGVQEPVDQAAGKRRIAAYAEALVCSQRPSDWTQSLMELGALICKPANPDCGACPLANWCVARVDGVQDTLPLVSRRTAVRDVDRAVALWIDDGRLLFRRRPDAGLLAGMWDLPATESDWGTWQVPGEREGALAAHLRDWGGRACRLVECVGETTHTFSHVRWRMTAFWCTGPPPSPQEPIAVQRAVALAESRGLLS